MDEQSPIAAFYGLLAEVEKVTRYFAVVAGAGYIFVGSSWLLSPTPGRGAGISWLDWLTTDIVGWSWVIAGTVAVSAAILHRLRLLRVIGWVALIFVPSMLALYFGIAWVIYLLPGPDEGAERGIITSVSYGIFATASLACARISTLIQAANGGSHA